MSIYYSKTTAATLPSWSGAHKTVVCVLMGAALADADMYSGTGHQAAR